MFGKYPKVVRLLKVINDIVTAVFSSDHGPLLVVKILSTLIYNYVKSKKETTRQYTRSPGPNTWV